MSCVLSAWAQSLLKSWEGISREVGANRLPSPSPSLLSYCHCSPLFYFTHSFHTFLPYTRRSGSVRSSLLRLVEALSLVFGALLGIRSTI